MNKLTRRNFLKKTLIGTTAGIISPSLFAQSSTPSEVEGPFYPITPQKDKDFDLTRVEGKTGRAKGEIIHVQGQVLDQSLSPIEDVTIDLWQANSFGKYHHPHDTSSEPVDEHFQAWAIIKSGHQGRFNFVSVMPGAYGNPGFQRTPHIHLKISKLGYEPLLTQMYFPDHPLNGQDGLYRRRTREEQALMTAKNLSDNPLKFEYRIILESV